MSQIWCNSAKLMTALLGMGREGMISVWSSIWSVPLAGCRRDALLYASMLPIWHTHTHTQIHIFQNHSCVPVLNSGSCFSQHNNQYLVKLSVVWYFPSKWTSPDGLDAGPTGGVIVFRPGCFYFRLCSISKESGPTSIQFRELRGHTMTFYKICFTAGVIGIGY